MQKTKWTAEAVAAYKQIRLRRQISEAEGSKNHPHDRASCKNGHVWRDTSTVIYYGKRKCILCAEEKLEALVGSVRYLAEKRALERIKSGMPPPTSCQSCGSALIKGRLVKGNCTSCYNKLRRERYADMIVATQGRAVKVCGGLRAVVGADGLFYYRPPPPQIGSHAHWLAEHGVKAKRAQKFDLIVFDDKDDGYEEA